MNNFVDFGMQLLQTSNNYIQVVWIYNMTLNILIIMKSRRNLFQKIKN